MPFQNIPFVFGSGLDTITHPTQTPVGKLTQCVNAVFDKTGSITKRNGYSKLSQSILGSSPGFINNAVATSVFNETDLLLFDTNNIYSYLPSLSKWRSRGSCTAVQVSTDSIVSNTGSQTDSDTAILNDIQVLSWNDVSGGVRYSVVDGVSKAQITTNQSLDPLARMSRCVSFQNYLLIIYPTTDGRLLASVITPTGTPQTYTLVSDLELDTPFDVAAQSNKLIVAANSASDDGYAKLYSFNNLFQPEDTAVITGYSAQCFDLLDIDGYVSCSLVGTDVIGNNKIVNAYTDSDLNSPSISSMDSPSSAHNITTFANGGNIDVYFDSFSFSRPRIYYAQFELATASHITPTVLASSVSLISKCFDYQGRQYFFTVHSSDIQPTYFILNNLGEVVGKACSSLAGPARASHTLSSIILNDSGVFSTSLSKRGSILTNNNQIFTSIGIINAELDFNTNYHSVMLNGSLYLTGGILQQYDGNSVTEQGFHVFPENFGTSVSFGGFIEAGVRSYIVTFAWTDNLGKAEESGPSPAQQVVSLISLSKTTLAIPTLALTKKDNVIIKIYRTRAATSGDPNYYLVTSPTLPLANDPTSDAVIFVDTLSDDEIVSNEQLYCETDSNGFPVELENIPAPNCTLITTYKNRVFLAGTDNPNQIWYSKTVVPGEALAFNDSALTLQLSSVGGDITGLSVLDDNLVIFKHNAIFTLSGLGPTNAGNQNDFGDPQAVGSAIGCDNPNSIVLVSSEDGIYFHSPTGLWKIDRQSGVTRAGAEVDAFKNLTIVSGDQIPGTTQMRFLCSDGDSIVYDYFEKQWSTFSTRGIDAGVWNDIYYYVKPNGRVYLENTSSFKDDTLPISLVLATGELSFAGLQNYMRVESFLILGDYIGPHKLKISIAYGGDSAYTEEHVIDTTNVFDINVYGENNTFGENGVFGGSFYNEQFRIFLCNPVCQRLKVKIEEIDIGEASQAVQLVSMNFKVLVRQGLGKVAPERQA